MEDGVTKEDMLRILNASGVGLPSCRRWRRLPDCYICFFQNPSRVARALENHPDLYEQALQSEKPEEGFTWIENESLANLRRPERAEEVRREGARRRDQATQDQHGLENRPDPTLVEAQVRPRRRARVPHLPRVRSGGT